MLDLGEVTGGEAVMLTDQERSRHVEIVGATGSGKSKFLEHLIRQDITRKRGLCLIDPKGSLADGIEAWCASRGLGRTRRIHLIQPGVAGRTAGFNPLRLDRGELPSARVDATVAACAQVWGGENLNATPRLKKVLRAVFFALAVRDLTLAEAPYLLRAGDPDGTRRALTNALPDSMFQFIWDDLNALSRREFTEFAESTVSRITQFLASPAVRLMVGQCETAIDFARVMDEGDIVIVNLGARGGLSREDARVVGALLINDLFLTALARDEAVARRHPFTLYVDECQDYLSGDVEALLDRTRSLGLAAVLAHQRLGQLTARGDNIYNAVMGSTRTKIVFGGLPDDDAGAMVREIMRDEINLEEAKPILDRPAVVGDELTWLSSEGWAESEGGSRTFTSTTGESEATSVGEGSNRTFSERWDAPPVLMGSAASSSVGSSLAAASSVSDSESSSWSRTITGGRHEAVRNVWGTVRTPYSIEEQLHRAQARLRSLPDRTAVVKRSGQRSVQIQTRDVPEPLCSPKALQRFRDVVCTKSPYMTEVAVAETEMATRQARLGRGRATASDESFWNE